MNPGDLVSNKYRLMRPLGTGGMGSVWAVRNELTNRDFAIKFLLPSLSRSPDALQRFFHEARACGQIRHPALVDVYDMGQAEDGSPYLVMELLDGEGLDQRLHQTGRLPALEAAAWLAFVARGLEEAHVRGLIHRDLKPGNIFLTRDASGDVVPKILDFGVSKVTGQQARDFVKTSTGAVLGSPAYMSPEQACGETHIDGRSDVWSLGVILYEALTGAVPFDAPNYNALMVAIMNKRHRSVNEIVNDVPPELALIVDRALAKDPARRIGTARELAERLEAVIAMLPPTSRPVAPMKATITLVPRSGKTHSITQRTWSDGRRAPARPRAGVIGLSLLVGAALISGGTFAVLQLKPLPPVAARSAVLLTRSLARLEVSFAELKAQIAAEQRAAAEEAAKRAAEEREAAEEAAKRATEEAHKPKRTFRRVVRNPQKDPHGGVEGPGF